MHLIMKIIVLRCSVVRMANPHSTFGCSRFGCDNFKTLAKNNNEGQNEFIDYKIFC